MSNINLHKIQINNYASCLLTKNVARPGGSRATQKSRRYVTPAMI